MNRYNKSILNPITMFFIGLIFGIVSKLLDIYSTNLGNMFSGIMIWILFGTLISIYSKSKKQAMRNIFLFCIGMLITYYFTLFIISGIYNTTFIIGWTLFAFCSPILAYFTWITKEKGVLPKVISIGIILVSIITTIVLFDKLRFYDYIILGLLIYYLFIKKIER